MQKDEAWDLVVIGAGPAGCAAAITAAAAGLSVAIVESQPFPRERPGETLHPGVEPLLERLGVAHAVHAAGFLRCEGHWVQWGSAPARFQRFGADAHGPWLGFQAWRADLDALLMAAARRQGALVFQPCRALRPLQEDGVVCGVLTNRGTFRASFVVDAAGGRHWLMRHLGQPIGIASPRRIARFGYLQGEWPEREHAPLLHGDNDGWRWVARVRSNIYAWTHLPFVELPDEQLLPGAVHGLQPQGRPIRTVDVTWRCARPAAGSGWFLTGDAAFVLDPASGHGVLKALMSGMMAAHCIVGVVQDGTPWQEAVRHYDDWIQRRFDGDTGRLRDLYRHLTPMASSGPAAPTTG